MQRKKGLRGVGWPRVVDRDQAKAISALQAKDLETLLGSLDLAQAIKPAVACLTELKKHLDNGSIKVMEPGDWADPELDPGLRSPRRSIYGYRLFRKRQGGDQSLVPEPLPFSRPGGTKARTDDMARTDDKGAPDGLSPGATSVDDAGDLAAMTAALAGWESGAGRGTGGSAEPPAGAGAGLSTPAFDVPGTVVDKLR